MFIWSYTFIDFGIIFLPIRLFGLHVYLARMLEQGWQIDFERVLIKAFPTYFRWHNSAMPLLYLTPSATAAKIWTYSF